jgi:hypothetical protein
MGAHPWTSLSGQLNAPGKDGMPSQRRELRDTIVTAIVS